MSSKLISMLDEDTMMEANSAPQQLTLEAYAAMEKKYDEMQQELAAFKEGHQPDSPTAKIQRDHAELEEEFVTYRTYNEATNRSQQHHINYLQWRYIDRPKKDDERLRMAASAAAQLQAAKDRLEVELARSKGDSEDTIKHLEFHNHYLYGKYKQVLKDSEKQKAVSDHEIQRLKCRIRCLTEEVQDGEADNESGQAFLKKQTRIINELKEDKLQLEYDMEQYKGVDREMEVIRNEKFEKDREYADLERKMKSLRQEKSDKDHIYAVLCQEYEMLQENQFHIVNNIKSESTRDRESFNEAQAFMQVERTELLREDQDLKAKVEEFENAIPDIQAKHQELVEKIIRGYRTRFAGKSKTPFKLDNIVCSLKSEREQGAMPLQMLALELKQEEKQVRQKAKLCEGEVDRIFESIIGVEGAENVERLGESSTQGDEPAIPTPDTYSPFTREDTLTREDLESANLYDSETDEEAEPSQTPSAFAAYVNPDDEAVWVEV